jgi:hypothetical protein
VVDVEVATFKVTERKATTGVEELESSLSMVYALKYIIENRVSK